MRRASKRRHGSAIVAATRTHPGHPVGKLELQVPQDRQGRFATELLERYQRAEKAFVARGGVKTRKVKAIREELHGHFSASAISAIEVKLDEGLAEFDRRRLD